MKNKHLQILLLCIIFYNLITGLKAQEIKDVFILVDVSGTMKNQKLNNEARSIVKEILKGNYDLNNHTDWDLIQGVEGSELISNPRQVIQPGTYINIIPFGDKSRYLNIGVNKKRVNDLNDFELYYNKTYNFSYKDHLTYLNLLKSYVAGMAQKENIEYCYVFTISDNLIDETGSVPYSKNENAVMNAYLTEKDIKINNIGILTKTVDSSTCGIYMEKFEKFTKKVSVDDIYSPIEVKPPIEITSPVKFLTSKNRGTKKDPLASTDFRITLKWKGGKAPYSLVIREDLSGQKIIDETVSSNSYLVKINNSGIHFASISDATGTNDDVYFNQSTPFPFKLIIGLLIFAVITYFAFQWWTGRSNNPKRKNENEIDGNKDPFNKQDNPFNGGSTTLGGGVNNDW